MKTRRISRAFTLVELLVVIVIIGILSSLVTVGVMSAVQAAKRAKIATEMNQITLALESYKNKFGEYPPDLYDKAAVVRHIKKRWPRFQLPANAPSGINLVDYQYWALLNAVKNVYQNQSKVDMLKPYDNTISTSSPFMNDQAYPNVRDGVQYVGALAFWLGGFPNEDGKFAGFSADPEAPFGKEWNRDGSGNTTTVKQINNGDDLTWIPDNVLLGTQDKDSVFYEMIIGKNIAYVTTAAGVVFPVLVNVLRSDHAVPYVYLRGSSSGNKTAYTYSVSGSPTIHSSKFYNFTSTFAGYAWAELGLVSAYAKSGDPSTNEPLLVWQEPERFQLIHPGLDGIFGTGISHPAVDLNPGSTDQFNASYFRSTDTNIVTNDIGQKDFDNITNFSDYQQIKSILP
ncbi:MAG: type II secretion system GspH family protein [Planctomycetaceae bacterium]|jgi:prepilin-type N-terminal cleavage/methylation domain-containing protein|nr:type II secretion system GspH family protein [Planctomycetaceae bacterium]